MKAFGAVCVLIGGLAVASLSAEPSATTPVTSNVLAPGQSFGPGEAVVSDDGRFTFTYQSDGNLVLYGPDGGAMWSTGTVGTSAGFAIMQGDGNFVIYDGDGNAVWASNTAGSDGTFLVVQNDGNVVIYDAGGSPLWATGTGGL